TILSMTIRKSKVFWIVGSIFTLTFAVLFIIRLGILDRILYRPRTLSMESINAVSERDTWMNIFQNERKIGFSHTQFHTETTGYRLTEAVHMRINTMGMIQDISLKTKSWLNPDFTLKELDFEINSGRFSFSVRGSVDGNTLQVTTESAGSSRGLDIPIKDKLYLFNGIMDAIAATDLKPGNKYTFNIFDPASMGQAAVIVEIIGEELVEIRGFNQLATKISLNFKGVSQLAWIGKEGEVVKEKGLLGISLIKSDRKEALGGLAIESSQDLTRVASVASNIPLENVEALDLLKVKIQGIPSKNIQLQGGRQTFKEQVLTVQKEALSDLAADLKPENLATLEKIFLKPGPFIQSDHQKIRDLAQEILEDAPDATPLKKAEKLLNWVHTHIEKRPVLSLPDALSTLENRVGDCNEHAVLLAALGRAAGIPTRIEAGMVYLKGRFYYHAWNLMYLGQWVTADSLFGQLPADVSHLRFATGSPSQQLDLMGVIGKVQLTVIK
ncbi:MAG: transglutaminase domain-containing protein, partial [Desulfobacterales bacterium]|nr:transglutaminase domain-containing protein [Desulfobacterales bacterium]